MPHVLETVEGPELRERATQTQPFGPGYQERDLEQATKMIVRGSSFGDPGDDWVDFELYDEDGSKLDTVRVGGY